MSILNNLLSAISLLVGLLIFILPSALVAIPKGGIVAAFIVFLSIVGLFIDNNKLKLSKLEKYFILSFVCYFLWVAINLWWFDGELKDLDTPSRIILVLPIFFFIRKSNISPNWLIWGIVFGSILTGGIKFNFFDINYLSKVSTVQTGIFSLFSAILSLSSLMFINKSNPYVNNIIFFTAFIFGIIASFLSGGRGVWVASMLTILILLIFNPIRWRGVVRLAFFALFSVSFLGSYFISETGVKNRIDLAINNTEAWFDSGWANSSSGARLEMWKASFEVIKENPIIGVGEDNYAKHQQKLIDQGKIDKFVGHFAHPHGEYITSLVEQGFIGLLAFIAVLFVPLKYLLYRITLNQDDYGQRILITSGLLIVLHYAFYSVTSGVFDHQSTALFYSAFMAIILGLIKSNLRIKV